MFSFMRREMAASMWRGKSSAEEKLEGSSHWLQCLRFCFALLSIKNKG